MVKKWIVDLYTGSERRVTADEVRVGAGGAVFVDENGAVVAAFPNGSWAGLYDDRPACRAPATSSGTYDPSKDPMFDGNEDDSGK